MSSVLRFDEWQDSEGNTVYDGATGGLIAPGLVAVKSALKTDTFTASVAAGGNVAVTDLSITHALSDASNKLIISAFFGVAANSNGQGNVGIAIHDGTALIATGDSAGSRTSVTAGGAISVNANNYEVSMPSVTFVHTPGSGSKTYTVHAINITGSATLYINRSESDADTQSLTRGASSLVIQEVAV